MTLTQPNTGLAWTTGSHACSFPPLRITISKNLFLENRLLRVQIGEIPVTLTNRNVPEWFNEITADIIEFLKLPANWDQEGAPEIDNSVAIKAICVLNDLINKNTARPYTFPTPHGGIQFEWHLEEHDLELRFLPDRLLLLYTDPDEVDYEMHYDYEDYKYLLDDIAKYVKHINN